MNQSTSFNSAHKRRQSSRTLAGDSLDLVAACIIARLPATCSTKQVVYRALEFACNFDVVMQDETALKSLFDMIMSFDVREQSGSLRKSLSGATLHEFMIGQHRDVSAEEREEHRKREKGITEGGTRAKVGEENTHTFLSYQDLAKRWGLSTMTLRRWRRDGRLHSYHFGKDIRFKLAEILEFERLARA